MASYSLTDLTDVTSGQLWIGTDTGSLMYTDDNGKDHKVDLLIERIEALEKRLAILEDPTPEQLEKHKMLKEAYTKYKFIEGLCSENEC